jgi:hypothetical protein
MSSAKFDKWYFSNGNPVRTVIGFQTALFRRGAGDDSYITIANNSEYDTPISITYTPKSPDSLLFIHGTTQIRIIDNLGMHLGIKRDGNKIAANYNLSAMDFFYKGESVNHHNNMQALAWVPAVTTAPSTFWLWVRTHTSGGSGELSNGWGQHVIQITEFAQ